MQKYSQGLFHLWFRDLLFKSVGQGNSIAEDAVLQQPSQKSTLLRYHGRQPKKIKTNKEAAYLKTLLFLELLHHTPSLLYSYEDKPRCIANNILISIW